MRGAVHCGICGRVIRADEDTARFHFNLCHAACVERIEAARYEDYVMEGS